MKSYPPVQFTVFRILLGIFMAAFFLRPIPFAAEVFSAQGMFPDPPGKYLFGVLPNCLAFFDQPAQVRLFLGAMGFMSGLLALGIFRRWSAVVLWYALACMVQRNPQFYNVSFDFLGWMLLVCALVRRGEPFCFEFRSSGIHLRKEADPEWRFPAVLFWGGWVIMALGYSLSGYVKLLNPLWQEGTAVYHVVNGPIARPGLGRDLFLNLPLGLVRMGTWFVLAVELFFAPLSLFRWGRAFGWTALAAMHAANYFLLNLGALPLALLLFHLLLWDGRWVKTFQSSTVSPVRGSAPAHS